MSLRQTVLLRTDPVRSALWAERFAALAPEFDLRLGADPGDPAEVDYLVTWRVTPELLASMPRLQVVFSSGAGVDQIDPAMLPPGVQLARMVEPGIVDGMVEYVTMNVLALHRDLFEYQRQQAEARWQEIKVRRASSRSIGVLGLGVLGQAVLQRLGSFGFGLHGWSRGEKSLPGVTCHHGDEGLTNLLAASDIVICLLPLTDDTRGILGAPLFERMRPGASLINVGRGGHLDAQALLAALDEGHLHRAVLDVLDPEPLPAEHPLWRHPRVTITPHIASMTQPESAAEALIADLRRHQRGEAMVGRVDLAKGY